MDDLIIISHLNDFIFCPVSIYFHKLYGNEDVLMFQSSAQLNGTKAHRSVDNNTYSTRKNIITNLDVYCEHYGLIGKIDIYDSEKRKLTERKKHIGKIYDGYIFQIYAQYFAMTEMGYPVEKLEFYSMDDNRKYPVLLPEDNQVMKQKFEEVIRDLRTFDMTTFYQSNIEKCSHCIYEDACDRASIRKE